MFRKHTWSWRLVTAVFCFAAISFFSLNPMVAAEDLVNIGYKLAVKRPILIERTIQVNAKFSTGAPLIYEETTKIVDEHLVNSDDKEIAIRKYVQCRAKTNKDISDPAYDGLEIRYARDEKDISLELIGDRVLPTAMIDRLLGDFDSISFWSPFPEGVKIGEELKLKMGFIAPLLGFNGFQLLESTGDFKLKSYNREGWASTLEGEITLRQEGYIAGYATTTTVTGKCTIVVSRDERCIRSMVLDGKIELKSDVDSISASGSYHVTLKSTVGKKPIRERKRKYKPRFNTIRVPSLGVIFKLPSSYARIESDSGLTWCLTQDTDKGLAYVELTTIQGDPNRPNLTYDRIEGSLKKDNASVKTSKMKTPLGLGRIYYIPKGKGRDQTWLQSELYPLGSQFLLIKLSGPPKAFRNAVKNFQRARKSLRRLR